MRLIRRCWMWIRSFLWSLIKRSFKSHASIWVSDLEKSLNFYKKLGFLQVASTRSEEVVLLRNHRGDELNLVPRSSDVESSAIQAESTTSFQVDNLEHDQNQLRSWYPELEITDDSISKRFRLIDLDANALEFFELLDPERRAKKNVYHIATQSELVAGLSDHYYFPPNGENRFVRTRARSAFLVMVCKRVADEAKSAPLVIEMNQCKLSIEEQLHDELDFDSKEIGEQSTYPHVNSPIPRHAIVGVGKCEETNGDFLWPAEFVTLDSIKSSPL